MAKLPSPVEALLLAHIPKEESAAREYHARYCWAKDQGYTGSARVFAAEAQHEHAHTRLLMDYALARGSVVPFPPLEPPDQTFASLLDCYETALVLENEVQASLEAIASAAMAAGDHATVQALAALLSEQVRAADELTDTVRQLQRIGDDAGALALWDLEQAEGV